MTTPNTDDRFSIIYRELAKETDALADANAGQELDFAELRGIDELRRFAMEVSMPSPSFSTGT